MCDDVRMTSGISTMAREFVMGLAHKYNWVQLAGSVSHPENGKIVDLSQATATETGVHDASVKLFPINGYGNADIVRQVMQMEKPDAILHFTDPRFWQFLYNIEREIRQICPIGYYSIWDATIFPTYNRAYYESCDWIGCISKQTENIVENVLGPLLNKPTSVSYVPHGINPTTFHPVVTPDEQKRVDVLKNKLLKGKKFDFVLLYNNRNIRRKQTSTILFAWRSFCSNLTAEERSKVAFILHTQPIDDNGTDLPACVEAFGCENVFFSTDKLSPQDMNLFYNLGDVTINLSDNEGFGLGTAESLMAGTPIIVTVTGGLQDQCGFKDTDGNPVEFTPEWGSNSDGKYRNHGSWVTPIYPGARMMQGSVQTPYLWADYGKWEDAAEAMMYWYLTPKHERKTRGQSGREYCLGEGKLNAEYMCQTMSEGLDSMMANWNGRERFNLHRHDEYLGHKTSDGNIGTELPAIDREAAKNKW